MAELAQRNPANLFDRLSAINAEKQLVRKLPTTCQVEDWVAQAKDLPHPPVPVQVDEPTPRPG